MIASLPNFLILNGYWIGGSQWISEDRLRHDSDLLDGISIAVLKLEVNGKPQC
jgi:hypothetical protein